MKRATCSTFAALGIFSPGQLRTYLKQTISFEVSEFVLCVANSFKNMLVPTTLFKTFKKSPTKLVLSGSFQLILNSELRPEVYSSSSREQSQAEMETGRVKILLLAGQAS